MNVRMGVVTTQPGHLDLGRGQREQELLRVYRATSWIINDVTPGESGDARRRVHEVGWDPNEG